MICTRDEQVHHQLNLYLFNHLNYLYPYLKKQTKNKKQKTLELQGKNYSKETKSKPLAGLGTNEKEKEKENYAKEKKSLLPHHVRKTQEETNIKTLDN